MLFNILEISRPIYKRMDEGFLQLRLRIPNLRLQFRQLPFILKASKFLCTLDYDIYKLCVSTASNPNSLPHLLYYKSKNVYADVGYMCICRCVWVDVYTCTFSQCKIGVVLSTNSELCIICYVIYIYAITLYYQYAQLHHVLQ